MLSWQESVLELCGSWAYARGCTLLKLRLGVKRCQFACYPIVGYETKHASKLWALQRSSCNYTAWIMQLLRKEPGGNEQRFNILGVWINTKTSLLKLLLHHHWEDSKAGAGGWQRAAAFVKCFVVLVFIRYNFWECAVSYPFACVLCTKSWLNWVAGSSLKLVRIATV